MALLDEVFDVLFTPSRMIGFIVPNVVIEEIHRDELAITQHPVEIGATITDHAFKLPAQLEMRVGFSDSGKYPGYSKAAYAALLALQVARTPMQVSTGKRVYQNMLIAGLTTITDEKTENALMIAVRLQEINLVSVTTTSAGAGSSATGGATNADQANPAATADTVDTGTKQTEMPTLGSSYPGATTAFGLNGASTTTYGQDGQTFPETFSDFGSYPSNPDGSAWSGS